MYETLGAPREYNASLCSVQCALASLSNLPVCVR